MVKASTLPLDTDAEIQRGGLTCSRSHGKPGACGEPSRPPPVHSRSLLCPWTWGNEAERRGRSEREKAGRALGETAAVCALPGGPSGCGTCWGSWLSWDALPVASRDVTEPCLGSGSPRVSGSSMLRLRPGPQLPGIPSILFPLSRHSSHMPPSPLLLTHFVALCRSFISRL